MPHPVDRKATN